MLSCVECQSSFDPKRPKQVFCSDNCRKRNSKRHRIGEPSKSSTPESIMRRCVNCGSPIELPKSQQVFCDNKCSLIFFTYIAHQTGDSVMLRKGAEDRIRDLKIYVESYPEIVANYGAYKPSEAADHPATIQASGCPATILSRLSALP